MKTIYLHGFLAKKYSKKPIQLDANTPYMIMSGLCSMFGPQFKKDVKENYFEVVSGSKDNPTMYIDAPELVQMNLPEDEFHLTPVLEGSGNVGRIILGAALITISVIVPGTQGWLTNIGAGLVLGGVAGLLAPVPRVNNPLDAEQPDRRPSFLFRQAINVYEQGGPVPLVYGRMKTGTTVISVGYSTEEVNGYFDWSDYVANGNWANIGNIGSA